MHKTRKYKIELKKPHQAVIIIQVVHNFAVDRFEAWVDDWVNNTMEGHSAQSLCTWINRVHATAQNCCMPYGDFVNTDLKFIKLK